jgi:hypothetical protein
MDKTVSWKTGINDFCEKRLVIENGNRNFTCTIQENEFEPNRDILDIFHDHLKTRNSKTVEVLYSGGVDSELLLVSCLRNKIPCEAVTMEIRVKGAIINVHDLYYSEKFCREHHVKQRKHRLDVENFFYSGLYKEYLAPYDIITSNVATHFWLMEKCDSFPVFGGDWPWVQVFKDPKVLSPIRLDYNSYDRFMQDRGITGIPNMISHSYESCYKFMQLQIEHAQLNEQSIMSSSFLKHRMYKILEPRIRSYGWESCERAIFNIAMINEQLRSKYKTVTNEIFWGDNTKKLLNTSLNYHNKN